MNDSSLMRRCFQLARSGSGYVSPNPLVGCVLVNNGRIIGEGFHREYGGPHAEVNAVNSVRDQNLLKGATAYVNLEPCSHFGKTPPCADLLIKSGIARVVISNRDPFEKVAGRGVKRLEESGIEVVTGILEEEGNVLNKRFFTAVRNHRPYITLKWAQSNDGYISPKTKEKYWLSNPMSKQLSHVLRRNEDAILVGKNTYIYDKPLLNCRLVSGKNPIRVILDSNLEIPEGDLHSEVSETLLFNLNKNKTGNPEYVQSNMTIEDILKKLHERGIHSLIVEGGSSVLQSFIAGNYWNEAHVIQCPKPLIDGVKAPKISGECNSEQVGSDLWLNYQNHQI